MIFMNAFERRILIALTSIFSLRMLGLFMILPVFALYAPTLVGVTPLLVGFALGIYGLTQALLQIPFGFASDHFGRKPIIVMGLLLFGVGSVVAALSNSIYGVIIGRSLQGASAIGSVIMALVSDLTREAIRGRAMAIIGISIGLSFAVAFLLGPCLAEVVGVRGIFWITALFSLLAIGVLLLFVPTPIQMQTKVAQQIKVTRGDILKLLSFTTLTVVDFGILVLHMSVVALFLKIPVALQALGFVAGTSWKFYLPVLVCALFATVPGLWLMERPQSAKYGIVVSVLVLTISEVGILLFFKSSVGLALSLFLFFTAFNLLEASLPALVSKFAPSRMRGSALGIYSTAQFLGSFVGGGIGGWLDSRYGMVAVLIFCIGLAIIWFMCALQQLLKGSLPWQEG